jgi:RNA polymerase sigma factor (TIGR02999 family)
LPERAKSHPAVLRSDPLLTLHEHGGAYGASAEELLPQVYDRLRRLASTYLQGERADHTLSATAVVHEAYLRLADQRSVAWQGRTHFFAVGARMMRRVLVDYARTRKRSKRGGAWLRVTLDGQAELAWSSGQLEPEEILGLDAALGRLEELDPRQARVVELRFFAGLGVDEVASVLGVSRRTVEGEWTHAKAWLRRELRGTESPAREKPQGAPDQDLGDGPRRTGTP